jgi:hypothetical protein
MPVAKPGRETAPFAALLGHKQNCIEHFKVLKFYVSTLDRQAILDLFVLMGVISINAYLTRLV